MMPSLRKTLERKNFQAKQNRLIQRGFPKGVLLEIGLFLVTDRFKIAFKYMKVCKTIYNQCANQPRFWYHLFVQKYPKEFMDQYYNPLMGESNNQGKDILSYLTGKLDQFFEFHPKVREVDWKQIFLSKTIL
jgi:hypothetical protein